MPVCTLRDGAAMVYADEGAGPAIVLVHGLGAHAGFFSDLSKRLAATHRVLTPTLRAHPGSDEGDAPRTIETLAQDIVDFTEALGLKSFTALGWSMGAMALWAAAPRLGARLNALIVEDMAPRVTKAVDWAHGLPGGYSDIDVAGTVSEISGDWPGYVARFAPRMFAPAVREARPDLIAWTAAEMSKANGVAMASYWASMAAQDFREPLARITAPMLVIHGSDSHYPDGAAEFISRTAPNARRMSIQNTGHVPHLEAPDQFFTNIETFVRGERRNETKSGGAVP
jgi:pimeloyl-ACP methyl ester carboxylesterase